MNVTDLKNVVVFELLWSKAKNGHILTSIWLQNGQSGNPGQYKREGTTGILASCHIKSLITTFAIFVADDCRWEAIRDYKQSQRGYS